MGSWYTPCRRGPKRHHDLLRAAPQQQTYAYRPGDIPQAVAELFYGDGNRYREIAEADGITNPDLVNPADGAWWMPSQPRVLENPVVACALARVPGGSQPGRRGPWGFDRAPGVAVGLLRTSLAPAHGRSRPRDHGA
ncbi:hypothetical protein [Streptomyces sp. NPDC127112]|uniref:hypothetical protein n=1 Tax=Streptomyces sp. NPDC127112 TaxID=3345364 RepID=UPI003638482C